MINKSRYQWCFDLNIRPLDLKPDEEDDYFLEPVSEDVFIKWLHSRESVKPNSQPRKPEKFLELRMYGFVPYNISEIQKGIQFGHAVVEYSIQHNDEQYQSFAKYWKTFIILNGGTTNNGHMSFHGHSATHYEGSLQGILASLKTNDIKCSGFDEPDLNNALSAVVFIVDERVFNKELYPDFKSHPYPWLEKRTHSNRKPTVKEMEDWQFINDKNHHAWVEKIGGPKNAFLRELLKDKRLA